MLLLLTYGLFLLYAGFAGVTWKWREAERQKVIAQDAQRQEATQRDIATRQADVATREVEHSHRLLYAADMNLAHQAFDAGDTGRARELLEKQWPGKGQADLRGFEWYCLWKRCQDTSAFSLRGPVDRVLGILLSGDGRTLISGGDNGPICVWDLASRQPSFVLAPSNWYDFWTMTWALSPDGKTLALAQGTNVTLWNRVERRVEATLPFPKAIFSLALSPRGDRLAVGCRDGDVHVIDLAKRRELAEVQAEREGIPCFRVAFSPDGGSLATGGVSGLVQLWDAETGRHGLTLAGHTGLISALVFTPDGKRLATASQDASIRLWDTASGAIQHVWRGMRTSIYSAALSPDGSRLVAGGEDGSIRLWDIDTRQALAHLRGHTAGVTGVAFAPDGQTLYSGSVDGTVKAWDLSPRQDPNILTASKATVGGIAFSHGGKTLAIADCSDYSIRLWDLAAHRWIEPRLRGHEGFTTNVSFSPDDRLLVSAGFDEHLRLWDVATRQQVAALPEEGYLNACGFSPDGRFIAAGGLPWNGIHVWDTGTRRVVRKLPGWLPHFSPAGDLLASVQDRSTIRLWKTGTWEEQTSFAPFSSLVSCPPTFARDGKTLAAGETNGTIWLWDVTGNRELAHHRGHTSGVNSLAFSPDGRRLATGGKDGLVKLWELPALREVATLTGHDGPVTTVAFAPDGLTLASAGSDATVRLWTSPPPGTVRRTTVEPADVSKPSEVGHLLALDLHDGAQAIGSVNGSEYEVQVTKAGSINWHVQLGAVRDDLVEGTTYAVRFRARADVPHRIGLYAQRTGVPDWQGIGLDEQIPVTQDWTTHEVRFQATDVANRSRINFNVGRQVGKVWIADFTFTKIADPDPGDAPIQRRLRQERQRVASERGAEEELPLLARAFAEDPKDTLLSMRLASLQAWFGREKELAATLRRIREFARDTDIAETAERAAKTCSIVPAATRSELDQALALARRGLELDGDRTDWRNWRLLALGMVEYRSGHDEAAIEALLAAEKADPTNLKSTGIAAFYRAMSLFRQGKEAEARQVALEAAAAMKPLPKDEKNPLADEADHDDLILWLAYKEAKALIRFDEPTPPGESEGKR